VRHPFSWCLWPLLLALGCASQGGSRFPFGGRQPAEPDSAALRMAAMEQRLGRIDAALGRLEALIRQNHAATQAELGELRGETRALGERVSGLDRRQAGDWRTYAPGQPGYALPPGAEEGLVRLDDPGRGTHPPAGEGVPLGPGWSQAGGGGPIGPGGSLAPAEGAPGGAYPETAGESPMGGALEGRRGDPPAEGQRLYQVAYQDLMEENYQLALINFRAFLERFPQTRLSDNAQYWIGEVYYGQRQFQTALEEFRKVIEEYPEGDKVPAAYYKIALCFQNLRDLPTARRYLEFLIRQHPDSREARLAEAALREL